MCITKPIEHGYIYKHIYIYIYILYEAGLQQIGLRMFPPPLSNGDVHKEIDGQDVRSFQSLHFEIQGGDSQKKGSGGGGGTPTLNGHLMDCRMHMCITGCRFCML